MMIVDLKIGMSVKIVERNNVSIGQTRDGNGVINAVTITVKNVIQSLENFTLQGCLNTYVSSVMVFM